MIKVKYTKNLFRKKLLRNKKLRFACKNSESIIKVEILKGIQSDQYHSSSLYFAAPLQKLAKKTVLFYFFSIE